MEPETIFVQRRLNRSAAQPEIDAPTTAPMQERGDDGLLLRRCRRPRSFLMYSRAPPMTPVS